MWAKNAAASKSIPKVIDNGTTLVTKANTKCWCHGPGNRYSYPLSPCST
jgi:hypothetical protein